MKARNALIVGDEALGLLVAACEAAHVVRIATHPEHELDLVEIAAWSRVRRDIFGEVEEVELETLLRALVHTERRLSLRHVATVAAGRSRYELALRGTPVDLHVVRDAAAWKALATRLPAR